MANRTKRAIAQATQELLREKPLNKITIKEITAKCDLTRNSFYYHFTDIYDVVNWIFEDEVESFMDKYVEEQNIADVLMKGINFLYDNKEMLIHIYRTLQQENVERYLGGMLDNIIIRIVESVDDKNEYSSECHKITALFYRSAFVGVIQRWISDNMTIPPEPIAIMCDGVFCGTVKATLQSSKETLEALNIDKILS